MKLEPPIKTLFIVEYPVMLALGEIKRQTLLPSLLWICRISGLVCSILILNISANIFFPLGKMIGMMQL